MNRLIYYLYRTVGLAALVVLTGQPATAQINTLWLVTTGSYDLGSNWDFGFVPNALFDELAVINNGGLAYLEVEASEDPGGVILGQAGADMGTLEIRNGGSLTAVLGNNGLGLAVGNVVVGQNGDGQLMVARGGTLVAESLSSGGAVTSSMVLGETGGSGTASVTINGQSTLRRNSRIVGPNVGFNTADLTLTGTHTLISEITGASHSPLLVSGGASLNGAVDVEFNGYTPLVGDSWNLVDASAISGTFATVQSNGSLPRGVGLFVTNQPGGTNGAVAQLAVDVQLVLSVDRRTGATSIQNLVAGHDVDVDGYLITSPSGVLDPAAWNSFQDDGQAGWVESNPSPNHLGELNLTGSRTIAAESQVNLGAIYDFTPTVLGEPQPGVTFEYHRSGGGTVAGKVDFTGLHNNMVLLVDPETGAAAIQNQSPFALEVDGYLITSDSSSLDPSGWQSLEDSGQSGWTESNPAANHLGELNLSGFLALGAASGAISIGSPFDFDAVDVQQDLNFEFHLAGGDTMTGVVEYGPFTVGGPNCDFDGNGACDIDDIDALVMEISSGGMSAQFDLNGDGQVNLGDRDEWLTLAGAENLASGNPYLLGDANLDGGTDVSDFNIWNGNKFTATGKWSLGDFNADGSSDVSDFNIWNGHKFQSSDGNVTAVPEPSAWLLAVSVFLVKASSWSRRRRRGAADRRSVVDCWDSV